MTKETPRKLRKGNVSWNAKSIEIPRQKAFALIDGNLGQDFIKEYDARALKDFAKHGGYRALIGALRPDENGVITGSDMVANVLAYEILNEAGLTMIQPEDVAAMLKSPLLQNEFLRDGTNDSRAFHTGFVVNPEDVLIDEAGLLNNLRSQLTQKGHASCRRYLVPFADVRLVNSDSHHSGLSLKLKDDIEPIGLPRLPNYKAFDTNRFQEVNPETGFPATVSKEGEYQMHLDQDPGVAGLEYFFKQNEPLGITTHATNLGYFPGKRIVLVKEIAEGTRKRYQQAFDVFVGKAR